MQGSAMAMAALGGAARSRPAPVGFSAGACSERKSVGCGHQPTFPTLKRSREIKVRVGKVLDDITLCQVLMQKQHRQTQPLSNFVEEGREGLLSRLTRAWRILFPPKQHNVSNAQVAKRRLKMILISDRCSVNHEAKRKIVDNIVGALADFVEIESEDKVALNVSSNSELGTVYYVTVPVRRVRPEYQDFSKDVDQSDIFEAT